MTSAPIVVLSRAEAASAAAIQAVIDRVASAGGGTVRLPAGEMALDRGLRLRDGVTLAGAGAGTVLRKLPARAWALDGYANYGMRDVALRSTAGLEPGMTVWITDRRTGGFHETAATITWVEAGRVGLDRGLESDYAADAEPLLRTMHPLVLAEGARDIAVRDLRLDGAAAGDPCELGSCRGGAICLLGCRGVEIAGVDERDFAGDGLSFQLCREVLVRDSRFDGNVGNGLHPGAGSTAVRFERVQADGNRRYGFFFCVRATRVTVAGCRFRANALGMSVGEMDSWNLVEDCELESNRGPGLATRPCAAPGEVHHLAVRRCRLAGNGADGSPQVHLAGVSHDLELSDCVIAAPAGGVALAADAGVRRLHLAGNRIEGAVAVPAEAVAGAAPLAGIGADAAAPADFRHLPPPCHP